MCRRILLFSLLTVGIAIGSVHGDAVPPGRHPDVALLPRGWSPLYEDTVFFPHSTAWREVPWLTNLGDAIAAGKKENRPILIWVAGDDPLERC